MTAAPWTEALAYAVTGQRRPAAPGSAPDVAAVQRVLEGETPALRSLVAARAAAGEPWPFPLPSELRAQLPSLAQFYAALQSLLDSLDLSARPTRSGRAPDADERRLIADRPPHWGRVG